MVRAGDRVPMDRLRQLLKIIGSHEFCKEAQSFCGQSFAMCPATPILPQLLNVFRVV